MNDFTRDHLWPADAPNPEVWCERCQKRHRQHTFTQADYDAVVSEGARNLADEIYRRLGEKVYAILRAKP